MPNSSINRKHIRTIIYAPLVIAAMLLPLSSCRIQPPLHLADVCDVEMVFPEVITDIEVIWGVENPYENWWYGWDEEDIRKFGPLDYPEPHSFEVRVHFLGEEITEGWLTRESFTVDGNRFHHTYHFGYHDLLLWSNIESADGTQVLLIDETPPT